MRFSVKSFLFSLFTPALVLASADVVTDSDVKAHCEELVVKRELRVFKDPSLFLPGLALIAEDPKAGWERLMEESPLLTRLTGRVSLMRLGKAREFKNFGAIAKLYEAAEPRLRLREKGAAASSARVIPIQICGDGSLGFVLESDLKWAALDEKRASEDVMPPSTYPNPVPRWKEFKSRDATK